MRTIRQLFNITSCITRNSNFRRSLQAGRNGIVLKRSIAREWTRQLATVIAAHGKDSHVSTFEIKKFLNAQGIPFEEGFTCFVMDCKFCLLASGGRGRHHDVGKLFINMTTGMFLCTKCNSRGAWRDLQDQLLLVKQSDKNFMSSKKTDQRLPDEKEVMPILTSYKEALAMGSLDAEKLATVLKKFNIERLGLSVLGKYDVRMKADETELLFPIHSCDGSFVGCYVLSVTEEKKNAFFCHSRVAPSFLSAALFGFKQLSKRKDILLLTATPLDVLAVAQETNMAVVSLPHEKSLPLEVLPLLEPYPKIILWLGNDMASWERSKMFAKKLSERRCSSIRPDESSPTPKEALAQGLNLSTIIKSAHPVTHKAITTFSSLRQQVFAEFSHVEQLAGVKWKRYPLLTKLLKGHRRGELTVFTGSTGSGKTTFISDYSLDLCIQGVRTLWGSFEIRNTRLSKMMLTQFSEISLDKCLDQYDHWADRFEKLPLFFLTFHGPQSIRSVLDAMRHAVYVHDIEHVIVDNLQFMLGVSEQVAGTAGGDRYWRQDVVVSSFRQFASLHNCHVTLVIHPRKENNDVLNNMSIFGGAKASQEADNILILQDNRLSSLRGRKYIQVTKNRFDGDLGIVPLEFDRETLSFMVKKKPRKAITASVDKSAPPSTKVASSKKIEDVAEKESENTLSKRTLQTASNEIWKAEKNSDSDSEDR